MRRVPLVVLLTLALAACGGGSSGGDGGGGGGGGQEPASVAPPVVNGELPGMGNVLFGSAWDAATLGVTGKTTSVKQGTTPLVAVGRSLAPTDATGITVQIGQGGAAKPVRPVTVTDKPDKAQLFATDLSADGLGPGTWIVSFLSKSGRTLASGYLVVTP